MVSLVVAPVHEVGRVAPEPHTGPRATCVPLGGSCAQGLSVGAAHSDIRSWNLVRARRSPTRNPSRMPHVNVAPSTGGCYLLIFVTWPAPTVRPPSRMANCRPSSMAIGWIS
jgi:hypothetical protein